MATYQYLGSDTVKRLSDGATIPRGHRDWYNAAGRGHCFICEAQSQGLEFDANGDPIPDGVWLLDVPQPTDQERRDATAAQARRTLADEHDAQQQEYERDTRLGQTPQADSFTYTARDGSSHAGRAALDMWGNDLRQIIRDAAAGTLDPAEELPAPPA